MKRIPELPVPVFVGRPGEAPGVPPGAAPFCRSHPDASTVVWCAGGGVDAEWDRPGPRVPRRLVFAPGEASSSSVPFWVHWTAKEAQYKKIWRTTRFVPAKVPVAGLRETPPPAARILRYFTWEGGFTACVAAPGGGGRRLWISVARNPPTDEMRNVT